MVFSGFLNDLVPGTLAQIAATTKLSPDDNSIFFLANENVTNGHKNRHHTSSHIVSSSSKLLVSYAEHLDKINSNLVVDNVRQRQKGGADEENGAKTLSKHWSSHHRKNNNNYDDYNKKSKSFAKLANKRKKSPPPSSIEYIKISRLQKRAAETLKRKFYQQRRIGAPRERQPIVFFGNNEVETQHEKPVHRIARRSATSPVSTDSSSSSSQTTLEKQQNYHQEQQQSLQKQKQTSSVVAAESLDKKLNESLPSGSSTTPKFSLLDEPSTTMRSAVSTTPDDRANQHKTPRHIDIDEDDGVIEEPRALPLRPIIRAPYEDDPSTEVQILYAEQRAPIKLSCEVDLDIVSSSWMKDGQVRRLFDIPHLSFY